MISFMSNFLSVKFRGTCDGLGISPDIFLFGLQLYLHSLICLDIYLSQLLTSQFVSNINLVRPLTVIFAAIYQDTTFTKCAHYKLILVR